MEGISKVPSILDHVMNTYWKSSASSGELMFSGLLSTGTSLGMDVKAEWQDHAMCRQLHRSSFLPRTLISLCIIHGGIRCSGGLIRSARKHQPGVQNSSKTEQHLCFPFGSHFSTSLLCSSDGADPITSGSWDRPMTELHSILITY